VRFCARGFVWLLSKLFHGGAPGERDGKSSSRDDLTASATGGILAPVAVV